MKLCSFAPRLVISCLIEKSFHSGTKPVKSSFDRGARVQNRLGNRDVVAKRLCPLDESGSPACSCFNLTLAAPWQWRNGQKTVGPWARDQFHIGPTSAAPHPHLEAPTEKTLKHSKKATDKSF
ncbi:hypothetical protein HUJ04_000252 [Dendroctonus ponderosae]|nr:hypothetical protein HUJ04_000252 [Dendroctonus ponderosae]KAH1003119.1 hypothetical protein HUJ05_011061 [Dendroctonus ponderosae]